MFVYHLRSSLKNDNRDSTYIDEVQSPFWYNFVDTDRLGRLQHRLYSLGQGAATMKSDQPCGIHPDGTLNLQ